MIRITRINASHASHMIRNSASRMNRINASHMIRMTRTIANHASHMIRKVRITCESQKVVIVETLNFSKGYYSQKRRLIVSP